ncbi:acetyltransferase [Listeria floridensis FSL S10-1187]|uniref:Acetyltransferase n=1 Tax=Listeria floridensis FSL S10-1187 TaxID=1265817 RepID=A0ABN0RDU4_9LIST|nr:acetyltransferase [Listeria floridensis FSL S10-1187]
MIEAGIERAKQTDYPAISVLGHAEYYPRFGFKPASDYGITAPFPVPDEAFLMLELNRDDLLKINGMVSYPKPFLEMG